MFLKKHKKKKKQKQKQKKTRQNYSDRIRTQCKSAGVVKQRLYDQCYGTMITFVSFVFFFVVYKPTIFFYFVNQTNE
jgi:hypothetical protein